jgi:hypothetical protein
VLHGANNHQAFGSKIKQLSFYKGLEYKDSLDLIITNDGKYLGFSNYTTGFKILNIKENRFKFVCPRNEFYFQSTTVI